MGSLFSLLFFSFLLSSGLMAALFPSLVKAGVGSPVTSSVELVMRPKHAKAEEYFCTYVELPQEESYIIGYEPHLKQEIAHHMLVFGCEDVDKSHGDTWNCMAESICSDSDSSIMYAWAKQAPGLKFPKGVGLKVGGRSNINYAVMQIHFHDSPHSKDDYPHLKLRLTTQRQPMVAAIYLLNGVLDFLPPGRQDVKVSIACKFSGPNAIHPIGFRTHAHSLSPLITGFVFSHSSYKWNLIGQHSPQEPQAFYPSRPGITVNKGDILAAQCHYNTSQKDSEVYFGPESSNEMCNFYIMFYMENNGKKLDSYFCYEAPPPSFKFPNLSQFTTSEENISSTHAHEETHTHDATPTIATPIHSAPPTITLAKDWEMNFLNASLGIDESLGVHLGQVAGISVDDDNHVYMFHRGDHEWDMNSFTDTDRYTQKGKGPIKSPALLVTDPTGKVTHKWGKSLFYLPHGLSIDMDGIIWMTDVARHQIFKLSSIKKKSPMALGAGFVPGSDEKHFCKPAAVLSDPKRNRIYVADGYCNHRIMVFNQRGSYITQYSNAIEGLALEIPHSLALSSDGQKLYVADRENYRIVEYNTETGRGRVFVSPEKMGGAIFAISFSDKAGHWPMYAVNGSLDESMRCVGFTINKDGNVIGTWFPPPGNKGFTQPHDIAVDVNGTALYVAEIGPNKVWKFSVSFKSLEHATIQPTSSAPPTSLTTSCLPSPSVTDEDSFLCPRPPPPPLYLSSPVVPVATETILPTTEGGGVNEGTVKSISVLPVAILVILMLIILALIILLVGFVALRKRIGNRQPLFKVRRHYSRHPTKKLDVLLHSMGSTEKKGFTKVKTFDSESEEEFTVFQKT